ncbi:hypothetical protein BUALT_Bualt12G0031200 [Buddleja alternifolia]|uniref:Uncharacterized protein n=1 Tax=Buddleja alternifolia TaxID=168488 RepID=A0AAV6WYX7_9LAMI|nr:hypothetical protein BUALT_Bualt12G0031200 [Buddleja alternifolia]
MGQSLNKLGTEQKRDKEITPIIEQCYDKYFVKTEGWSLANFYHAICQTIEFQKHHQGKGKSLQKEEFQKILREVILDSGVTNTGAKDMLFYLYGVPATALFLKQRLAPNLIPNEVFVPALTSATVFLLAKFNKI